MISDTSEDFIKRICDLYGEPYDDRIPETSRHVSLRAFQKKLEDEKGIRLSITKLQKILISGGVWSTKRSRAVYELYQYYTGRKRDGGMWMDSTSAICRIATELNISTKMVSMVLPYEKTVYDLEQRTDNAVWCKNWREKKR